MSTLYVTDMDGTLLNAQGQVSPESVRLLNGLLARGLHFTVATARSPATVVGLLQELDLKLPAVLMTGTMIYDVKARRAIATTPFPAQVRDTLCDLLDLTGQEALVYRVEDGLLRVHYREISTRFESEFVAERWHSPYKAFVRVKSYRQAAAGGEMLLLMMCLDDAASASQWYKAFSQLDGVVCYFYANEYGKGYTMEVYPAGCNKATGIETVRRMAGADRVVAFGDNVNDLPLFAASDESCAVAGAVAEVKEAADHVIGASGEDGVARWIAADFEESESPLHASAQ